MKIGIASDHRGFKLKELIKENLDYDFIDYGTNSEESTDYPIYAFKLGEAVVNKDVEYGVAICGSGIGISIACNKVKGIRCAKVDNVKEAKLTRQDNDSNVLALNGSIMTFRAKDIVDVFFKTSFSNEERHIRRLQMIENYEKDGKYEF